MNVILDTCIVLWVLSDDPSLTGSSRDIIDASDAYVSSISLAEIEIKRSIGQLEIPDGYREEIPLSGLMELAYSPDDTRGLRQLPFYHRDPFDRMLICQAVRRNMHILTADAIFSRYTRNVMLNGSR